MTPYGARKHFGIPSHTKFSLSGGGHVGLSLLEYNNCEVMEEK